MAEGINEHRIYVGNLDSDVDHLLLEETFSKYGEVCNVIFYEGRPFGFVSFRHKREARNAIDDMDGSFTGIGSPVRVEWANGWPIETSDDSDSDSEEDDFLRVFNETDPDNTTVFCGGLSDITRDLLERTFQPFGEIEEITCFDDSRNYAFVRFAFKEDAARAICHLNGTEVDFETIRVDWAHSPHVRSTPSVASLFPSLFASEAPSSESSRSSSPIFQDSFDVVMSRTTPSNRTVYVGGLESYVTENVIQSIFSQYGDIEEVNLLHNYGFIRFTTKVSAALAICARDQHNIYEGPVRCDWAHRQNEDPPQAVEAAAPSTADTPRNSQLQSEPPILFSGLAIVSEPESVQPSGATNAKETEVKEKAEVTKVDKKVEETKPVDLQCKICMDEQVGVVFLPCGHLASCPRCAQRISNCPMCRKGITGKVRTYLS